MKDENTRNEVRQALRPFRIEICGYQRAIAGVLAASAAANVAMYGATSRITEKQQTEIEELQSRLEYAERVKEQALEQYGVLVLELQRRSHEREVQEAQSNDETDEPSYVYVGECTITYYCSEQYPHICGNGDGLTAAGAPVETGIVAVDPNVIELGSTVLIDGNEYLAADTGGAIKGYRVDICTDTHAHALELGTHTADVYVKQ